MKVDGYEIGAVQIQACMERMRAAPFTREELIEWAAKAGVPRRIRVVRHPADRLAMRLIQQERMRGNIEQYERRKWRWTAKQQDSVAEQLSQHSVSVQECV
jgi:hypothetical protein